MVAIIRRTLVRTSRSALFERCVARAERSSDEPANLLRVITYHRVALPDERPDLAPSLISTMPDDFAAQMQHVAAHYHPVSAEELLTAYDRGFPLPPRSVLVTFDDAYRDFAVHAWPVLQRLGIPAVLFVATAYAADSSRRFWWDRLHAAVWGLEVGRILRTPWGDTMLEKEQERGGLLRRLRDHVKSRPHEAAMKCVDDICRQAPAVALDNGVLRIDEIHQLSQEGLTIAPHTRTHPLLNRTDPQQTAAEIADSCHDVSEWTGSQPRLFAYPSGGVDTAAADAVRRAGIRLAFTTRRGHNSFGTCDPLQLRRINIGRATTLPLFRAQLLPQARWLNPCWRG